MSAIEALKQRCYDMNALRTAVAIMDWDQQCYMPHNGASARAGQVSTLSRMAHEMLISDETKSALEAAEAAPSTEEEKALCRLMRRGYDQAVKFPASLVEEKARLAAESHEVWVKARKENDFASFAPYLERMMDITRQEAEILGYKDHIYDALIDLYEEGATKADCDRMFDTIREPLSDLVRRIAEKPETDQSCLHGGFDESAQKALTEEIVQAIGFSFESGRQDVAAHPFCTNFSVADVRLTTRYQDYLGTAIFGSLHEAGHGLYEQGSPMEWDRLPLAGGVSLGVHESQSRTWENIVGRSRPFWSHFLPVLQKHFSSFNSVSLDDFYRAANKVEPSLIRVEADEVTYNLHIMIRFEMECALLTGDLKVADVPTAWNEKYEKYLGIRPDSDSNGCMQDVHWSAGLIGYFPTYSMGNLLSYQIWNVLKADLGDVDGMMAKGNFAPILGWLQEKVYRKGALLTPKDLVMQVTGKPIGADDYMAGITAKYSALYDL